MHRHWYQPLANMRWCFLLINSAFLLSHTWKKWEMHVSQNRTLLRTHSMGENKYSFFFRQLLKPIEFAREMYSYRDKVKQTKESLWDINRSTCISFLLEFLLIKSFLRSEQNASIYIILFLSSCSFMFYLFLFFIGLLLKMRCFFPSIIGMHQRSRHCQTKWDSGEEVFSRSLKILRPKFE